MNFNARRKEHLKNGSTTTVS